MQDRAPDEQLIARAAAGDAAGFAPLVERYAPAVLRLARAVAPDEATAADVVQEAFLDAYRGAASFRPSRGTVRTWLFAIARHAARRARRATREVPVEDPEESLRELGVAAGWGTDAPLLRADERERLSRAIASLPARDREVLVLCDVEALGGLAAAEVLGVEHRALKSRLHRARMRLLAVLRAGEGGVMGQSRDAGGLSCAEVLERLGDYVDGELGTGERAAVDAHLRDCTVCERFGGRYADVVHAARVRLGAAPAVDDAQLARIREALERG